MTSDIENLVAALNRRLHEMAMEATDDCLREDARAKQWCDERWKRMNDETAAMRVQRDAMVKALCDTASAQSITLPLALSTTDAVAAPLPQDIKGDR